MPKTNRTEIRALTSLRAIAAALVFFYHFVYLRDPQPAHTLLDAVIENGFIGVTLFFVLSGFVLTLRYYDEVTNHTFQWKSYLRRRAARVYPIYFFLLAAVALMRIPVNITNVTLTQGFFTQFVETGLIAAWSLTVEECFYLMMPFVLSTLTRFKRLVQVGGVLLLWSAGMLAVGVFLVDWSNSTGVVRQAGFMGNVDFILHRTVFGYIFDFSVGMFAAILYLKRGSVSLQAANVLSLVGLVGIIGCQYAMSAFPNPWAERGLMYVVAVCGGTLIIGLTRAETPLARLLSGSLLVYMGRISYTLYLLQLTQLVWFMGSWHVVAFYAGTSILSALLYETIEEPSRRLILGKKALPAWAKTLLARRNRSMRTAHLSS